MNEYVSVDSNVFIQLLYEGPRASEAEGLLDKYPLLATGIGVVDEVLHFIIKRGGKEQVWYKGSLRLKKAC